MSTITREFTKEQLIEQARTNLTCHRTAINHSLAQVDAVLFEIALASLEAEAVVITDDMAYAFHHALSDSSLGADEVEEIKTGLRAALANVTAPPAPVSVHDENGLLPCPFCGGKPEEDAGGCSEYDGHEHQDYSINCMSCGAEVYCSAGSFEKADIPCSCHHNAREVCVDKWNRRAAMLQGAELVTTTYKLPFEEWLSQQNEPIDIDCGCVTTEVFYHWLRVAYGVGNSPVIPDGLLGCGENCWSCGKYFTYEQHSECDGYCPHCNSPVDLDDEEDQPSKVVPTNPTEEMISNAWREAIGKCDHETIKRIYATMLAAAPQQEVK
ncbi:Lar family restriction alleviation protein [Citrobacter freundii]|jgi:hypothetical protein